MELRSLRTYLLSRWKLRACACPRGESLLFSSWHVGKSAGAGGPSGGAVLEGAGPTDRARQLQVGCQRQALVLPSWSMRPRSAFPQHPSPSAMACSLEWPQYVNARTPVRCSLAQGLSACRLESHALGARVAALHEEQATSNAGLRSAKWPLPQKHGALEVALCCPVSHRCWPVPTRCHPT